MFYVDSNVTCKQGQGSFSSLYTFYFLFLFCADGTSSTLLNMSGGTRHSSPHLNQLLLYIDFLMRVILTGMR